MIVMPLESALSYLRHQFSVGQQGYIGTWTLLESVLCVWRQTIPGLAPYSRVNSLCGQALKSGLTSLLKNSCCCIKQRGTEDATWAEMLSSCMQCRSCAMDKAESPSTSDRKISNCQLDIVGIKGVSWIYIGRCSLLVVFSPFSPTCIFKTPQNYTVLDLGGKNPQTNK